MHNSLEQPLFLITLVIVAKSWKLLAFHLIHIFRDSHNKKVCRNKSSWLFLCPFSTKLLCCRVKKTALHPHTNTAFGLSFAWNKGPCHDKCLLHLVTLHCPHLHLWMKTVFPEIYDLFLSTFINEQS